MNKKSSEDNNTDINKRPIGFDAHLSTKPLDYPVNRSYFFFILNIILESKPLYIYMNLT